MPKNTELIGLVLLLVILNKKSNLLYDLHKMTDLLDRIDRLSTTANSLPDLNSIMQKIGPLMSAINSNSLPSYDDYDEENRNAIF